MRIKESKGLLKFVIVVKLHFYNFQMGIHEVGVRKDIMRNLEVYRADECSSSKISPEKVNIVAQFTYGI